MEHVPTCPAVVWSDGRCTCEHMLTNAQAELAAEIDTQSEIGVPDSVLAMRDDLGGEWSELPTEFIPRIVVTDPMDGEDVQLALSMLHDERLRKAAAAANPSTAVMYRKLAANVHQLREIVLGGLAVDNGHQPRENRVPCQKCGLSIDSRGAAVVRTWTPNNNAVCDAH